MYNVGREETERQLLYLDEEIKTLYEKIKQNSTTIENQKIQVRITKKIELLKSSKPKFLDLISQEKALEKRLKELNIEIQKRKGIEAAFIRSLETSSKLLSGVENHEAPQINRVLSDLAAWDQAPTIVQNHFKEQEKLLKQKRAELQILESNLDARNKNCFKSFMSQLKIDKSLWENEWKKKIEEESSTLKQSYEKIISDLVFEKRLLEISLFKT